MDRYKALDYKLDIHKVQEDNQRYIDAGHLKDALTLYNYFEPNPMPHSIEYIKSYFPDLENISVAVNLFKPGQYIPIHSDRYGAYKKHNGITEDKIISRARRTDVAFHAMRALQELSFDTFKSSKALEYTVPPTLKMPLPQDYVNYVKISCVDKDGIAKILYPALDI